MFGHNQQTFNNMKYVGTEVGWSYRRNSSYSYIPCLHTCSLRECDAMDGGSLFHNDPYTMYQQRVEFVPQISLKHLEHIHSVYIHTHTHTYI